MKSLGVILIGLAAVVPVEWKNWKANNFSMNYTSADETTYKKYGTWTTAGIKTTEDFFGTKFKSGFSVYVHPDRNSLDAQWQKDWQMPTFKSECWMVASGVGPKLDLLSPRIWKEQACDHNPLDTIATQQVIAHEVVHVFHGQHNASPDFSTAEGIDWFVEGLATYASGQLTAKSLNEIKNALKEGTLPTTLDKFWTGKWRYGLSGSMVLYIDKTFGREKLKSLLPLATKAEVLKTLGVGEEKMLSDWKKFIGEIKD